MRAFHDSMRLFVAGIVVPQPSGGSRNVNRRFSRMRLRTIRSALTRCWRRSATVPSVYVLFSSRNASCVRLPLVVGDQPYRRGISVRHAARGDQRSRVVACLPRTLASTWSIA